VRIYVSVGEEAGVGRPDLVAAIAGEVERGAIGAIEIADRYSLVEVPEAAAGRVVEALHGATLRGRTVTASVYRDKKDRKDKKDKKDKKAPRARPPRTG
jgi:ATP-dependent RNA helicase DeaD